jgi:TolB-like protein
MIGTGRCGARLANGAVARAAIAALLCLAGCAGMKPTRYVNPGFNFSFVKRVAVLPLENLANDPQAASRATRLFITELLATGSVEVVEPGDVRAAMARILGSGAGPTTEQVVALGKALQAQALVLGNVNESTETRAGTVTVPIVTLDLRMVETETGATVWAATHTEKGSGAGSRFLGTASEPVSETTRRCVKRLVEDLVR